MARRQPWRLQRGMMRHGGGGLGIARHSALWRRAGGAPRRGRMGGMQARTGDRARDMYGGRRGTARHGMRLPVAARAARNAQAAGRADAAAAERGSRMAARRPRLARQSAARSRCTRRQSGHLHGAGEMGKTGGGRGGLAALQECKNYGHSAAEVPQDARPRRQPSARHFRRRCQSMTSGFTMFMDVASLNAVLVFDSKSPAPDVQR